MPVVEQTTQRRISKSNANQAALHLQRREFGRDSPRVKWNRKEHYQIHIPCNSRMFRPRPNPRLVPGLCLLVGRARLLQLDIRNSQGAQYIKFEIYPWPSSGTKTSWYEHASEAASELQAIASPSMTVEMGLHGPFDDSDTSPLDLYSRKERLVGCWTRREGWRPV